MFESAQHFFESSSMLVRFVLVFGLILLAPKIFQRIKLPGLLAFILVGLLFGPKGLRLFKEDGEVLIFFAFLGKLLLLFFSGLDIDFEILRKNMSKSFVFAALSFTIPALTGILLGFLFGYSVMTSLMIGILFSSHSIIAFPILASAGLMRRESVTITIGATAITDIASLILLAICLPIHATGFLLGPFLLQLLFIIIFIPAVILGFKWLGKVVFKNLGEDPAEQLIFLLLVVAIAAQGSELVNIDPIVGAFLAGLAVSTTLPDNSVRGQLDTLGNTLFIPAFFISLGVLIDPVTIYQTLRDNLPLVLAIVLGISVTKTLAALWAGRIFGYSKNDWQLMGSLTLPQVSSTLAVALVAYESLNASGGRLIDDSILNSILVLMPISSVLGSITSQQLANTISKGETIF